MNTLPVALDKQNRIKTQESSAKNQLGNNYTPASMQHH